MNGGASGRATSARKLRAVCPYEEATFYIVSPAFLHKGINFEREKPSSK